ncbi:MAG TPA: serine protein kinase RIO [Methanospirillum sp.]|nr:serine protein kinase RIO [Methanospirillum sp.]
MSIEHQEGHFDKKVDAHRIRIKNLEEMKVSEDVFDDITLYALYKLVNKGWITAIGGSISTGKEANVFLADRKEERVAIKIYLTRTANFKKMQDYIAGDRRFLNIGKNRRDIIFAWTRKEFSNLKRAAEAGIAVPKPLVFDRNILVMEFLGYGDAAYPQLRIADIPHPEETYQELIEALRKLWQDAKLVHGDLSEYNILWGEGKTFLIDMGQAVPPDHPHSIIFLRRDVEQLNRFFSSRCETMATIDAMRHITGIAHLPEKAGTELSEE